MIENQQKINGPPSDTPFKMWIVHKTGTSTQDSYTTKLYYDRHRKPNLKAAFRFLKNYNIGEIHHVVFYENGVEFGKYKDGFYQGKYLNKLQ